MAFWDRLLRRTPPPRTAAVQPISENWQRVQSRTRQPWQTQARFFSENLGVIRFANGLLAQTAARCDLFVEELVDPVRNEWVPVENDPLASDIIYTYCGPDSDSAADLVARHVWHYKGAGECYMIVDTDPNTGRLVWSVRSTQAVDIRRHAALVMDVPGGSVSDGTARLLPVEQVRRLWVPDDEWVLLAQSPLRAVLADCERYWALARRIRREADSALTNGLLYTPGYAHTPTRPPKGPGDNPPSQFDLDYYRIAQRAFMDDDGVEAIAPMSVHYDAKDSTRDPMAPKFIYPDRMLDPSSIALRAEAVESIARGLDMPQSLVTEGPGGGNHWSSWLVDEKFATTSLAPVMDRVTHNDLSEAMLRPVLRELQRLGNWNGDPRRFRIGYDPTPVIVHPDRAAQAIQLYGLGLLQGVVTLEANGFDGSNAPSPEELAQILETLRAARGRQPEAIQLTTSPISNPPQTQGIGETTVPNATTPGAQRELPPAPAMAALGPYPNEVGEWLDPVA